MLNKTTGLLLSVTLLASGCASIVNGQNQSLSVQTRSKAGAQVVGASCKLSNDKGVWFVTTPGTTTVHRSYESLQLSCEKDGFESGLLSSKSSTKGMAFGNLLFGGVIGAGVDITTGAAYDYPEMIVVEMGQALAPAPQPVAQGGGNPVAVPASAGSVTR